MSKTIKNRTGIKNQSRKSSQRGFSNVQIAIGILVTVILLLGALSGYQYIQQAKVNNEVSAMTDLKAATTSLGQANGAFNANGDATTTLAGLNFFQGASFTVGGTATAPTVKNQWGGAITAEWKSNNIEFKFAGVPSSVCKDLLPKTKNIVDSAKVGTTTVTDLASYITACTPASGTTVDIVYSISR